MRNSVRHYPWGSVDSLPALLGAHNPEQRPWAEYWMGAHPLSPSRVYLDPTPSAAPQPLNALIAARPTSYLGQRVHQRFGARLPFLFKILSAHRALSIQAHPNRAQAQEGFATEERAGIPLHAPHRNYKDPHHKPEMVYALSHYWAMCGFAPPQEIISLLSRPPLNTNPTVQSALSHIQRGGEGGLSAFFKCLLEIGTQEKAALVSSVRALVHTQPPARLSDIERTKDITAARYWWVGRLLHQFPSDIHVIAPLYLNLILLTPGEALSLESGTLHAYLHGDAIEVMANSDNVLRGGLTSKHIDTQELMRILVFNSRQPSRIAPLSEGALNRFPVTADEFELSHLVLSPEARTLKRCASPEILLLLGEKATIAPSTRTPERTVLQTGESLFIPPSVPALTVHGAGELFRVTVAPRLFER